MIIDLNMPKTDKKVNEMKKKELNGLNDRLRL